MDISRLIFDPRRQNEFIEIAQPWPKVDECIPGRKKGRSFRPVGEQNSWQTMG